MSMEGEVQRALCENRDFYIAQSAATRNSYVPDADEVRATRYAQEQCAPDPDEVGRSYEDMSKGW